MRSRWITAVTMAALVTVAAPRGSRAGEPELIAVLKSDAALHEKARACQQLAFVGGKAAVPTLAPLLGDEQLGEYARFALERIDDPGVDQAFREALGKLEGRLLAGVVNSIGVRRDAEAVPALQELARDPRKGVTGEALMALGMIATDEAVATLRDVLAKGAEPPMRIAAADAALTAAERLLAEKKREQALDLYARVRAAAVPPYLHSAALYCTLLAQGDSALPLLTEHLKSDEPFAVKAALHAARELPGGKVAEVLANELETASPALQAQLIKVLVDRGDASALRAIEVLAASDVPAVQQTALEALGTMGKESSVAPLIKAAGAQGASAKTALGSLRKIEDPGVDAAILSELQRSAPRLRAELIGVLAGRHCGAAVPALLRETGADDETVAQAAWKALGVLASPKDLPAMVEILVANHGGTALRDAENAVVKVAAGTPGPVQAALARAKSSDDRVSLLRILGRTGGEKAYEAVALASKDPEPAVRDAAVRALAAWPNTRAADALLDLAKTSKEDTHGILALRGYVRLLGLNAATDPARTAERFAGAMSLAKTPDTRKAVLGGLAGVPHPRALELAMSNMDDASVRAEAELAAVTIARSIVGTDREAARGAATRLAGSANKRIAADARAILALVDRFADAITSWRVAGPYGADGHDYRQLFDIAFAPETPDAQGVEWRVLEAGTDPKRPWLMDLLKTMPGEQKVAYVLTWVHVAADQPARLELGTDDGVKAWLNGKLVHANNAARAAKPYTDKAEIVLTAGWNPLLLKITQNVLTWEFCARIRGRDGRPLDGIRVDALHDGNWSLPAKDPLPASDKAGARSGPPDVKGKRIFDGRTFAGWEGNLKIFRIEDGAIVGGSLKEAVPRNEFLCTTQTYTNFQLRLKLKLVDDKGNAGIQIRSKRIPNHYEMIGYQADVAATYWGGLYDESRRRTFLAKPDLKTVAGVLKRGGWNEYVIRCEGKRIRFWLNGLQTVDYIEPDPKIPQTGLIGLQIHGGPPSEIWYKDIEIVELP